MKSSRPPTSATVSASDDRIGLARDARRQIADFPGAVVVDCGSTNHRMDEIAVSDCILETPQTTMPSPLPKMVPLEAASNERQWPSRDRISPSR